MTTPTVSEYMVREVVYLRRADTVLHAREVMALGDLRHLPIVDETLHVIGIISDRDVLAALATGERKTVVGEIMTHPVHTVTATTPAHVAVARMLSQKIGALAVVSDEDPRLVGIVTETDFLVVAQRALAGNAP
jgi:CBS domain-containing protein